MAVARHNVNLTAAELRWVGRSIAGLSGPEGGRIRFEAEAAEYLGVRHVRAVDSGRVALHMALEGLGLGPGARIVLPRYCFYSLPHVVTGLGMTPVWAPVDPETMALDPERLAPHLEGACAVVMIHPFGQVGPVRALLERCDAAGVPLVEDGSQATGGATGSIRVGAAGRVGVFSLVSGKNLQTFGGGLISTDDDALVERIDARLSSAESIPGGAVKAAMRGGVLRWFLTTPVGFGGLMHPLTLGLQTLAPGRLEAMFHEERSAYDKERAPLRLSDAQGHLGCLELAELDRRNQRRRGNAHRLLDGLAGLPRIRCPRFDPAAENTFNAVAVRVAEGAALQRALRLKGVDTRSDYMSWYGPAQDFEEDVIYLPNHPGMSPGDVDKVVHAVRAVLR